ncbi:two-component sensor histidine kinase [Fibrella sp. HMF5405]|uniref:histidine kinase n=2 Tax=Fibrella forsythiae TaxID=2817061 RepID=A0ABS3JK25_9BACT|nr:two-component sensor histidine kinase [Fibrella forsythiae]
MGMIFFRNFWKLFMLFWVNVAAFFAVRYAITVIPPFLYIPEMRDVYNANIVLFFAGLFAVVYYFRVENSRQEKQLNRQNEQLQASLADLHAAQAQLVQREKLASLGELTAGVAHEIQNPLNFVNNFAELSGELADEHDKGANRDANLEADLLTDLQQNIGKISEHGKRAAAIVRSMLEHSRTSTGDREPTNLNTLCADYLQLSYGALKIEAHLPPPGYRTELDPDLIPLNVIPQDIGRVLLNLINNAFYAVLQRQRNEPGTFRPEIWVKTQQLTDRVEIRVGDNGTGIDSAIQAKIFQPFFTTKPTGSGTGLGLSLSYDIITKGYGGTLCVQSQPGQGAEFSVTLPIRLK